MSSDTNPSTTPAPPKQTVTIEVPANLSPSVIDKLKPPKPPGYSRGSVTTYYTRKHGTQLKKHLDEMIANPDKVVSFPARSMQCTVKTLHTRIYLAWRWIIENDDPDGKYAALLDKKTIASRPGQVRIVPAIGDIELTGVLDEVKADDISAQQVKALKNAALTPATNIAKWKDDLELFIQNSKEGDVHTCFAKLLSDDINFIQIYLAPFEDIVLLSANGKGFRVTRNSILASKMRQEES